MINAVPNVLTAYRTLDLAPGCSLEQVKRSYHILVRVWHPDRFGSDASLRLHAEEKLKQINGAYETLASYLTSNSGTADVRVTPGGSAAQREREQSDPARATGARQSRVDPASTPQRRQTSTAARTFVAIVGIVLGLMILNRFSTSSPTATDQRQQPAALATTFAPPAAQIPASDGIQSQSDLATTTSDPLESGASAAPTVVAPAATILPSVQTGSAGGYEAQSRVATAQRLEGLGIFADPQTTSLTQLLDMESRAGATKRLASLGQIVDWRATTLSAMLDMESKIGTARRLASLGQIVDWQTTTLSEMLDMEARIGTARRLQAAGVPVAWQNYSLSQLLDMEMKSRAAQR
jgi:hypothetical protein